jgi:hypothetical protein
VTNIAIRQFLWQRFNLVSGAIFVVFPYVISLCIVCVGYRKVCGLRKSQEILGVILSDVWPNMMTAASGSDGKKEKERQKGRLTITNSSCSNGTPSFPLSTATWQKHLAAQPPTINASHTHGDTYIRTYIHTYIHTYIQRDIQSKSAITSKREHFVTSKSSVVITEECNVVVKWGINL